MRPTASARSTIGTTVTVKDLFANYPVRQASSRSNRHAELTELHRLSVGIALSTPLSLTLRTATGEKLVKIDRSGTSEWQKVVLEKGLMCSVLRYMRFEGREDGVQVILSIYSTNSPRNYSFSCMTPACC
jgi:DNA mismatch repair ATPase MutL